VLFRSEDHSGPAYPTTPAKLQHFQINSAGATNAAPLTAFMASFSSPEGLFSGLT
jgi:hypothetical protein